MKIAIITTWNECCGIAEYSKELVEGLLSKGHEVKVFANFAKASTEPDAPYVSRVFHAPFLTGVYETDINFSEELLKYDLIHFGFETSLYHPSWFPSLIDRLRGKRPIIFTMHSSGIWSGFDINGINFITHEPFPSWNTNVIPMGIRFYDDASETDYKKLIAFGLGRNNDDYVRKAIGGMDINFITSYGHHKWKPRKELVADIQKAWGVSLIYPPVGANVSSSAVNLAIGCNRAIFGSNTNWFNHVRHLPGVYLSDWNDPQTMTELLQSAYDPKNQNNIKAEITERRDYIKDEGRDYDTWIDRHLMLYKNLV